MQKYSSYETKSAKYSRYETKVWNTQTTRQNNTITDGGSTAPLLCWYHTEEKTIQEHKRDWKDVRGIVGCQTSTFAPSTRRLLHCFLLKLGNNYHRLQQTATNCHILLKRADEELIKSWWRTDVGSVNTLGPLCLWQCLLMYTVFCFCLRRNSWQGLESRSNDKDQLPVMQVSAIVGCSWCS